MQAGKLRQRIGVEKVSYTQPSDEMFGEPTRSLTVSTGLWADIEHLGGSEPVSGGEVVSQATHRITVRWQSTYEDSTTLRFTLGSRVFEPISTDNPGGRNEQLVFLCREVV